MSQLSGVVIVPNARLAFYELVRGRFQVWVLHMIFARVLENYHVRFRGQWRLQYTRILYENKTNQTIISFILVRIISHVNATVDDDQCGSACPLARLVLNFCVPRDSDRADIRREYRRSSTYVRVCLFRYRMFNFSHIMKLIFPALNI